MGSGQRAGAGMAELKVASEINGMVWKVEVAPGDAVEAGATLIILESMKMEIPVAAPRAGRVKSILVAERDEVGEGQVLLVLEV
jgi:acetyl-CoA carboxylase biotin carboxyl carrier protein